MFRPVHGVRGYLTAAINTMVTAILLDDATVCLLKNMLPVGDYTYLLIQTGYSYEIVKTVSFTGNALNVVRAQDGTTAQSFPMNASVVFVLSQSAINDIVSQQSIGQIDLIGTGIVTVTKTGPNQFTIDAPEVSITSDSEKIIVGGDFPNFVISSPLIQDCCD
jgi:hypothetical protein